MRWRYPFQPPVDAVWDEDDGVTDRHQREERRRERDEEASHQPVAKPRVKVTPASKSCRNRNVFMLFCICPTDTSAEERSQRSAERE